MSVVGLAAAVALLAARAISAEPVELDRLEGACCVVDAARFGDHLVAAYDDPADWVGLRVYDYSDPSAPAYVSQLPLDAPPTSIAVSASGHVYAAMGGEGLRVVDVSAPAAPSLVGSLAVAGNAFRVEVRGTRAYVGTRADGLHVFDLASPAAPSLIATYGDDGRTLIDFDMAGTVAGFCVSLVAHPRPVSFRTVDLADPLAPVAIGTSEDFADPVLAQALQDLGCNVVASNGSDFFTAGDWYYIVSQGGSIDARSVLAFDAPTYASARYAGGLEVTSAPLSGVAATGAIVHAVNGGRLQIFDAGAPGSPRLSSEQAWNDSGPVHMLAEPGLVFFTAGPLGVTTFDVSDPAAPVLASHLTPDSGFAADVALVGDVVVVSDRAARLRVVDATEPSALLPVSTIPLVAEDIEAVGTILLVGTNQPIGLQLIDLSIPETPVLLGFAPAVDPTPGCHTSHRIMDVEVTGTTAAVIATCSGLHLFDVSDPMAPVQVANIPWAVGQDLDAQGTLLAVLVRDSSSPPYPPNGGVWLYDISDPASPQSLSWLGGNYYGPEGVPLYVKLHGGHAYVFTDYPWVELLVFDLVTPGFPEIASILFPAPHFDARGEVVADGDRLVPPVGSSFRAVDVADPTAPFVVQLGAFSSSVDDVVFRDGSAFTAEGENGLASYLLEVLAVPVVSGPLPILLIPLLVLGVHAIRRTR